MTHEESPKKTPDLQDVPRPGQLVVPGLWYDQRGGRRFELQTPQE